VSDRKINDPAEASTEDEYVDKLAEAGLIVDDREVLALRQRQLRTERPGTPGRHMAGVRDTSDNPIGRDVYACFLEKELDDPNRQGTLHVKDAEVRVAAELLDELAAVYKDEQLGRLARELAVKLYNRLGI